MLKVSVMVDEKKVSKLLWALDGLVIGPPEVLLVKGAKEVDGEVREDDANEQSASNGGTSHTKGRGGRKAGPNRKAPGSTLPDHVVLKLLKERPAVIDSGLLRSATAAAGGSADSYSYVITALRKWGILSGPTAAGFYTLNEAAYRQRIEGGP